MYLCKKIILNNKIINTLKTTTIKVTALFAVALFFTSAIRAQVVFEPIFTQVSLEARADFDYQHVDFNGDESNPFGFHGKYFNFVVGGNLGDKFSYFFRQRIIAKNGSVSFYDNTDFLYLTYNHNKNWMFRLGKDALAVGGFEYDAAPIDVLFSTNYWDNFYCFQLGGAAAYKSNDGNHMFLAQIANSPYVYYGAGDIYNNGIKPGDEWRMGLLAYSLYWSGKFGHFNTLYSVNMFERPDHNYLNYIALGNKIIYNRWDFYLDLIHHSLSTNDWGKDFAAVACFNFHLTEAFNIYGKWAYEQNLSDAAFNKNALDPTNPSVNPLDPEGLLSPLGYNLDVLIGTGNKFMFYGIGFEYNPPFCKDVRLHGVVSYCDNDVENKDGDRLSFKDTFTVNLGITWHMNIHRMFRERGL